MARNHSQSIVGVLVSVIGIVGAACGGSEKSTFPGDQGGLTLGGNGNTSGLVSLNPSTSGQGDGGTATDSRCSSGAETTISGTVYDPGLQNPLYNITVFIPDLPNSPLPNLPRSGASCAACADLYPATVNSVATTDVNGHFTLSRTAGGPLIPVGTQIPLVVQTGKWRMQYAIGQVDACTKNTLPDKTLHLPANASQGNLPDIAISTGGADSLECLPLRIGVSASEYAAGNAMGGHMHVYQGAQGATTNPAAPASSQALWDSTADLQRNDVVLLSCEGAETSNMSTANQQSLLDYANGGGRVFASHFHYAWFNTGPFSAFNLATWFRNTNIIDDSMSFPAEVVTTLNVGGAAFPEGQAMQSWLGGVNALTNGSIPIWFARHNANVTAANTASQPWIVFGSDVPAPGTNSTQYFSFDTPVNSTGPEKCGRVVYSDLHVSGGPGTNATGVLPDYAGSTVGFGYGRRGGGGRVGVAPSGCAAHPLTPQEKALEFMLFDLSSCLQTVGQPQTTISLPPPR